MSEENKKIVTPEGYTLRFRKETMTDVTLQIPEKAMRSLRRVAERRSLPIEAVMKFYIGQGLRQGVTDLFAG